MSVNLPRGSIVINGKLYNGQAGGSFYKTDSVDALAGATSVTITDGHIKNDSPVIPYSDNGADTPIPFNSMTLANGQCVLTFDALEANTSFYLIVMDGSGTSGGGGGLLPHLVITADSNSTVTVVKGQTSITATETSSGIYECNVPDFGTYTINGEVGGESVSGELVVDAVMIYEYTLTPLLPQGDMVLPVNDIQIWLKCATINDKSYTTLNEVLADTDTFTTLLQDSNASDYMARSTTWATTICADADAMRRVGMYDYCSSVLLGNNTWCEAICNSTYFESILDVRVPVMTSNTTPSGVASCNSSQDAYYAFDNNSSSFVLPTSGSSATDYYIAYEFTADVLVCKMVLEACTSRKTDPVQDVYYDMILQGYDGSNWEDISSNSIRVQYVSQSSGYDGHEFELIAPNSDGYIKYRMKCSSSNYPYAHDSGRYAISVGVLQFYGRHEAQTNIIHGATNDLMNIMQNGSTVAVAQAVGNVATFDFSTLNSGVYDFTSTTAKNPSDLSADYSKSIRITPNTVEVYCMPDNCFYWYGWMSSDLENIAPSTGWAIAYAQTYDNPTYNTYNFAMNPSALNKHIGVGSKTAITGNPTVKAIVDCIRAYNGQYCFLSGAVSKSVDYNVDMSVATQSGMQVMSCPLTQNSENIDIFTAHQSNAECYALWYE